ncbi:hypothetical protein F4679DRAFT_566580 [Xylaria curta]|nr:hypothetical protein F4679DRAFT_566580 [Xylaria curta]
MILIPFALFAPFLLAPACVAETVQDDWVFPQKPDFSTSLQLGREYRLQWTSALQNWFNYYCPDCNPNSVDLWVQSGRNEHKIASGVNVTSVLSVNWTAIVPMSELSMSQTWVLRFVPSGQDPDSTSQQISSSVFNITDPDAVSSSTASVSSPTISNTPPASGNPVTSATTGTESMTTSAAASTETMTSPQPSSGLSTGAKAGIGVGAGVGAIALFTLGWFLARHHRSRGNTPAPAQGEMQNPAPGPLNWGDGKAPQELHGTALQMAYHSQPPVEADSSPAHAR